MLNPDFRDMLSALSAEGAEFMLVGAYALAAHGLPRATGDMDIWIRRSDENAQRVWRALKRFKVPLSRLMIGYRFVLLDAGHLAQNVLLACEDLHLAAVPLGGFDDDGLAELLELKPDREAPLYAILIGTGRS